MTRITLRAVALAAALAAPAAASAGGPCPGGEPTVGDLGIERIECNCSFSATTRDGVTARAWRFRSEPVVRALGAEGPARAALRVGDEIAAVDGMLITTLEGGRRFANLAPGETVTLLVRRDGRTLPVRLTARATCLSASLGGSALAPVAPAPPTPPGEPAPAAPAPPASPGRGHAPPPAARAPAAPRAAVGRAGQPAPAPRVAETLPRGWIGIGLSCLECGAKDDGDGHPVWTFGSLPQIYQVEPGSPAARAGLRRGDQLTHIDGVSLLTDEGGRRFGAVRPGQTVRWTVRRGGETHEVRVVAEARQEPRHGEVSELLERVRDLRERGELRDVERELARLERSLSELRRPAAPAPPGRRLRYAGAVGGSEIEVRGLGNVVVDDTGDEVVITTPDATIRIRPAAELKDRPRR